MSTSNEFVPIRVFKSPEACFSGDRSAEDSLVLEIKSYSELLSFLRKPAPVYVAMGQPGRAECVADHDLWSYTRVAVLAATASGFRGLNWGGVLGDNDGGYYALCPGGEGVNDFEYEFNNDSEEKERE